MENNHNKSFGEEGEKLAVEFLIKKGYKILERNWRFKRYEIDVIAQQGDRVVFVEVKTRITNHFGEPEVFVGRAKETQLQMGSLEYIIQKDHHGEIRFDIISIVMKNGKVDIFHIEDAFWPRGKRMKKLKNERMPPTLKLRRLKEGMPSTLTLRRLKEKMTMSAVAKRRRKKFLQAMTSEMLVGK